MYNFDPVINYGPNDAGVSAISIFIVTVGIMLGSFLIFSAYEFLSNLLNRKEKDWCWEHYIAFNLYIKILGVRGK